MTGPNGGRCAPSHRPMVQLTTPATIPFHAAFTIRVWDKTKA